MKHPAVKHLSDIDPVLGAVIAAAGPYGLEPTPGRPPFQHLARSITYQQLNGTAAATIFGRFVALYPEPAGGTADWPFPSPEQVLATPDELLRGCGLSYSKLAAIKDLSAHALRGVVPDLDTLQTLADDEIVERLTAVRGIGRWTVEMMLMFQLGRPDVLPIGDYGVCNGFRLAYGLRSMPTPKGLAKFGERWAPHRTAAAWYLWRAVDLARAGSLPPPPKPAPRVARVKPKAKPKPQPQPKPKAKAAKPKPAKAPKKVPKKTQKRR